MNNTTTGRKLYLIGSLRNKAIHDTGNDLRKLLPEWEIFNDWMSPGPEADDHWRQYESARGRNYLDALGGWAASHVFEFDKHHLDTADAVLLVSPAGKSGHMELGYSLGRGVPGFYLLDDPERWDVMLKFCTGIYTQLEEAAKAIDEHFSIAKQSICTDASTLPLFREL